MSKQGVRPNRCPYCGRKCDGLACAQHRALLALDYPLRILRGKDTPK